MVTRRNILKGIGGALIAAPFVAKAGVLMPVRSVVGPDSISWAEIQKIKKGLLSNAVPTKLVNDMECYVIPVYNSPVYNSFDLKNRPETVTFRRRTPFFADAGGSSRDAS